ncbi:orotidine-5'-phosphate decarboxylase [Pelotomaculum propionicicum]|uniref:Orotidine 5'-phosphate decarboxylase n=1 Tax=Pelotomaculum propionicicum TaxID=258475 RepID=A0A4Y7RMQ5_9FIRM|nr:orotidine-5'-phosphate decarboxylase [Pelotomaculum propionicicum]NLI11181.1 orotidine-5'-phosphate decarboxylase [Peptococcaceae bacterium]TEB10274.1 Orotidine 5'-phosphate decarboxylase [Pelotomaculum propionicicum]
MDTFKNPLLIALDVNTTEEAEALVERLAPYAGGFKVGMQLYNSAGPEVLHRLKARQAPVFVDLKFHDIPNTVAGAARVLTRYGAAILNVHAAGGGEMMRAAVEATRDEAARASIKPPLVVAVTVLTSIGQEVFNNQIGLPGSIEERVVAWALLAKEAGLDGVVASPREVAALRKNCGKDFVIITPGIRPAGAAAGDQKRTMTPGEAVRLGATFLVVGRPVTAASDPVAAAMGILAEIEAT